MGFLVFPGCCWTKGGLWYSWVVAWPVPLRSCKSSPSGTHTLAWIVYRPCCSCPTLDWNDSGQTWKSGRPVDLLIFTWPAYLGETQFYCAFPPTYLQGCWSLRVFWTDWLRPCVFWVIAIDESSWMRSWVETSSWRDRSFGWWHVSAASWKQLIPLHCHKCFLPLPYTGWAACRRGHIAACMASY